MRWIVIAMLVAFVGAFALAVFLPRKPSAASIALDAKLDQLRADGEPLTPEQIARVLPDPDPEHDARVVLRDALAPAPRGSTSQGLPLAGGPLPRRGVPIPEETMQKMAVHLSTSDELLKAIPDRLDNVWFSIGWTNGFTNLSALPVVQIRALAITLALKTIYEAERADTNRAVEALRKGFGFVRTVPDDGLLDTMIRAGCASFMCDAGEQALNRVRLTDDQLAELHRQIKPDSVDDFEHAFIVERYLGMFVLDPIRQVHRGIGKQPAPDILFKLTQMFRWRSKPLYRDEDYLLFLNTLDERRALRQRPAGERLLKNQQIDAHYSTNAHSLMAEMVASQSTKALRSAAETKARLVALNTALTVERYRLAHNDALPEALDTLVPQYLSAPPRDPFDEHALRFKKLTRGYVIYSIGADGADNGGVERPNQQATNNYDVTITIER